MSLPFENTTVSEARSTAEIVGLLEEIGFQEIGQISQNGKRRVIARHNGAEFHFQVDLDAVKQAFLDDLGQRTRDQYHREDWKREEIDAKIAKKAERVAWRLISHQVKSLCDSIKLGVVSIAQAFGGHLLVKLPGQKKPVDAY